MANRETNPPRKKKKNKTRRPVLRVLGTIALIGVVTCAMLACMAVMYIKIVIMPEVGLTMPSVNLTTTIYYTDENGNHVELQRLHGTENRIWVPYDEIPQNLIDAAVAIEDKRFYSHNGVDWIRTAKGVINMFTGQDIQGGSTITQQLIKNLTTEDQVTVKRKISEIFRALEFENNSTKEEILEWYLNYIFLGEGCNGVYTASYAYFGKHVSDLSLAECASLIGITNNPSQFNPYISATANKNRQELILEKMLEQDYITQEEYDAAMAEELQFFRGEDEARAATVFSWYEDEVINQVIADLKEEYYPLSDDAAAMMVYAGGLQIYSALDKKAQDAVDAVYGTTESLPYPSSSGQPMQSAIAVIDNETGLIVALAGGMGEKTSSRLFSRATRATRPPGSSIKPLSVYAPALEMGLITPVSVFLDAPVDGSWPVNAYRGYLGNITVTKAVQESSNPVAVRILQDLVTIDYSYEFLEEKFGISTLVPSRVENNYVYTDKAPAALALGGLTDGVRVSEMAAAYSVFPRNGVYVEPKTYTKVLNADGEVILEHNPTGEAVLKERTAHYINKLLSNAVQNGTGRRANFSGNAVAGKTGTTTKRNDIWFVGYTEYYTAAVWTGYDVMESIRDNLGNTAAPLWKMVMEPLHADLPYVGFSEAQGLQSVAYCTVSGMRANEFCVALGTVGYTDLSAEDMPHFCSVHDASSLEPKEFDINDESTWPVDDENFDPTDPSTWPQPPASEEEDENGEGSGENGEGSSNGDGAGTTTEPEAPIEPTEPTGEE